MDSIAYKTLQSYQLLEEILNNKSTREDEDLDDNNFYFDYNKKEQRNKLIYFNYKVTNIKNTLD